jgi:hypothetical protein
MNSGEEKALWSHIVGKLDQGRDKSGNSLNWRERIDGLGQLDKSKKRREGRLFSDDDVFEAMLKSLLSNSTDWSRVERVSQDLPKVFSNFSLSDYAKKDATTYVSEVLIPKLKELKVGSDTLGNDLKRLVTTANTLLDYSNAHGSADKYFDAAIAKANGDPILATVLIGTDGEFKLRGFGIPLAAEAMKNLGYEVAKPDRHICRAAACWEMVSFRDEKWKAVGKSKTQAPNNVRRSEFIDTMRAMESLASAVSLQPSYVDQVVWLLCAKSGCHLTNAELMTMKP